MKGPFEKGDQLTVLEYMKGGQMVTHPCAPLPRIKFFIRSLSPSPEPDTPPMPPAVVEVPHEVVAEPCPKPRHTTLLLPSRMPICGFTSQPQIVLRTFKHVTKK